MNSPEKMFDTIFSSIIARTIVCLAMLSPLLLFGAIPSAAVAQVPNPAAAIDASAESLLNEYGGMLRLKNWKVYRKGNALTAYRYSGDYREVNASTTTKDDGEFIIYEVHINVNGSAADREFRIRKNVIEKDKRHLARLALPFLMAAEESSRKASDKKIYFSNVSAGYDRFKDGGRFYPEYGEGCFYTAFSMTYDPSAGIREEHIPLSLGDYFTISAYLTYDNEIRENSYNINLFLYGGQEYYGTSGSGTRFLHGFFTGLEYFRPSGGYTQFTWQDGIYSDHPHIQFILIRAVSWGCVLNWGSDVHYSFSFLAGLGPSINSSLNATNIAPANEKHLGFIFHSKAYGDRRQNFYYGVVLPAALTFSMDIPGKYRIDTGYNLYFFMPVENEKAYDMLNSAKISPAYYFTDRLLGRLTYELWYIDSLLRNSTKQHAWNRLTLALEYLL